MLHKDVTDIGFSRLQRIERDARRMNTARHDAGMRLEYF